MARHSSSLFWVAAAFVVGALFFSGGFGIFSTSAFEREVKGVFSGFDWSGKEIWSQLQGTSGSARVSDSGVNLGVSASSRVQGTNVGTSGMDSFVSADVGGYDSVEVYFSYSLTSLAMRGVCSTGKNEAGSATLNVAGYSVTAIDCQLISRDSVTLRLVRNAAANSVDLFFKECLTCDFRYVKTQAFSPTLTLGVGAQSRDDGAAQGSLSVEALRVVKSGANLSAQQECVTSQDCWDSKKSCGYSCNSNRCSLGVSITITRLCEDNVTVIGVYPVCQQSHCPAAGVNTSLVSIENITGLDGRIPIVPSKQIPERTLLYAAAGFIALLALRRLL